MKEEEEEQKSLQIAENLTSISNATRSGIQMLSNSIEKLQLHFQTQIDDLKTSSLSNVNVMNQVVEKLSRTEGTILDFTAKIDSVLHHVDRDASDFSSVEEEEEEEEESESVSGNRITMNATYSKPKNRHLSKTSSVKAIRAVVHKNSEGSIIRDKMKDKDISGVIKDLKDFATSGKMAEDSPKLKESDFSGTPTASEVEVSVSADATTESSSLVVSGDLQFQAEEASGEGSVSDLGLPQDGEGIVFSSSSGDDAPFTPAETINLSSEDDSDSIVSTPNTKPVSNELEGYKIPIFTDSDSSEIIPSQTNEKQNMLNLDSDSDTSNSIPEENPLHLSDSSSSRDSDNVGITAFGDQHSGSEGYAFEMPNSSSNSDSNSLDLSTPNSNTQPSLRQSSTKIKPPKSNSSEGIIFSSESNSNENPPLHLSSDSSDSPSTKKSKDSNSSSLHLSRENKQNKPEPVISKNEPSIPQYAPTERQDFLSPNRPERPKSIIRQSSPSILHRNFFSPEKSEEKVAKKAKQVQFAPDESNETSLDDRDSGTGKPISVFLPPELSKQTIGSITSKSHHDIKRSSKKGGNVLDLSSTRERTGSVPKMNLSLSHLAGVFEKGSWGRKFSSSLPQYANVEDSPRDMSASPRINLSKIGLGKSSSPSIDVGENSSPPKEEFKSNIKLGKTSSGRIDARRKSSKEKRRKGSSHRRKKAVRPSVFESFPVQRASVADTVPKEGDMDEDNNVLVFSDGEEVVLDPSKVKQKDTFAFSDSDSSEELKKKAQQRSKEVVIDDGFTQSKQKEAIENIKKQAKFNSYFASGPAL
eukprot:CAMPEP_0117016860 /NCGR_PEP_ID=MMETSP0472-20121206/13252_1 /TAXON_ID=693140 ORGANISM="Tiarina fusus, Strain LIS" /NCGR_SAMPLE_ID=MMETSP0472 /ASSEMBLY_ACC=CAM_ASM_000603 /LENGTH=810 /DNA_ID=CAMNT_0004721075 /DNA_START=135 /DNA_END=2567 /DNA_ORIENTATION=+